MNGLFYIIIHICFGIGLRYQYIGIGLQITYWSISKQYDSLQMVK